MVVILGLGDVFYFVFRVLVFNIIGFENFIVVLGIGKFIILIIMIVFYIILYYVWCLCYKVDEKGVLIILVYVLVIIRIVFSFML